MRMSDWSSDVCSSDLGRQSGPPGRIGRRRCRRGGRVMSVWISGAGTSHFGKQPDLSVAELAWQAIGEALDDEGADATRPFDAVFVGSVFGEPGVAMRVLQGFAIRSEEHTSELQSLMRISYAVFCLKKTNTQTQHRNTH